MPGLCCRPSCSPRRAHGLLLLYCVAVFAVYFQYDLPAVVSQQLKSRLRIDNEGLGVMFAVYAVPNVVLPALLGSCFQRTGLWAGMLLLAGCCFAGNAITVFGLAEASFVWVVAGRFVFGVGTEALIVGGDSLVPDWFRSDELGFAFGAVSAAGELGSVAAFYLAPDLTDPDGIVPSPARGLDVPFWAGAMFAAAGLASLVVARALDTTPHSDSIDEDDHGVLSPGQPPSPLSSKVASAQHGSDADVSSGSSPDDGSGEPFASSLEPRAGAESLGHSDADADAGAPAAAAHAGGSVVAPPPRNKSVSDASSDDGDLGGARAGETRVVSAREHVTVPASADASHDAADAPPRARRPVGRRAARKPRMLCSCCGVSVRQPHVVRLLRRQSTSFHLVFCLMPIFMANFFTFIAFAPDLIHVKWGLSERESDTLAGLCPLAALSLSPVLGWAVDKWMRRSLVVVVGMAVGAAGFLFLALVPATTTQPHVGLVLAALAYCSIPVAVWPLFSDLASDFTPLYGLSFSVANFLIMVLSYSVGSVTEAVEQSHAHGGGGDGAGTLHRDAYWAPMMVLSAMSVVGTALALWLWRIDDAPAKGAGGKRTRTPVGGVERRPARGAVGVLTSAGRRGGQGLPHDGDTHSDTGDDSSLEVPLLAGEDSFGGIRAGRQRVDRVGNALHGRAGPAQTHTQQQGQVSGDDDAPASAFAPDGTDVESGASSDADARLCDVGGLRGGSGGGGGGGGLVGWTRHHEKVG